MYDLKESEGGHQSAGAFGGLLCVIGKVCSYNWRPGLRTYLGTKATVTPDERHKLPVVLVRNSMA